MTFDRRTLPHSLEAEASILGGVIIQNENLERLAELETDDFYDFKHKVVWQAIRNLESLERPIDVITLEDEIAKQGKIDAVGGFAFLGELCLRVPTVDNVIAYRDTVRLHSRNRRTIIELSSALERAQARPNDAAELIGDVVTRLTKLDGSTGLAKRIQMMTIAEAIEDAASLAKAPVYTTPFPTLNDAIGFGGFLGTQVYTVAAGTGRGKTTFVGALGAHASETVPVIVASYEMRPIYFVARKAAGVLGVHSNEILRGGVNAHDVLAAMPYPRMRLMHKRPLAEVRLAVEWAAQKYGTPPLVIVDYIQKLADEIAAKQQRPDLRMATSEASATLLDIADRTGAAIIAVSAVGRGKGKQMQTPRKYPPYELVEVSKESGAVEYDGAGLIVLTLSDEYEGDERIATITLAKARFGQDMHIDARYHGARGTWRDCGRVMDDGKSAAVTPPAPKDTTSDAVLRERIIASLQSSPARNKTVLVERVKGNKKEIARVFELLRDENVIAKIPNAGFALAIGQRSLEGV